MGYEMIQDPISNCGPDFARAEIARLRQENERRLVALQAAWRLIDDGISIGWIWRNDEDVALVRQEVLQQDSGQAGGAR